MVWAERDLKDLPVCPFYSSHRREFIRDKKNTQLLIMSDGFSFQLRACHLASNPEKADRERNTTVLGWEELFTRIAPSAQKCCIFHLCGEKKNEVRKILLRTAWPCWRKGLLCFPTGAWNRQKWKLMTKGTAKNTPSSLDLRVVCPHCN